MSQVEWSKLPGNVVEAFAVLDEARATYEPVAYVTLFSGGHDSLTATALAFEWARMHDVPMVACHIDTGTGVQQTREFVEETCLREGWPLKVYEPPVKYEELVLQYGFPGPGQHGFMYQRLKERCLRMITRDLKEERNDRVMFVTGVRSQESVRRMAHVERIQKEGARVWAAAIWDWSKIDCANYCFRERGLARSPVVDLMHMSGECRCGAFARPGELQEWVEWFPKETEWILDLQEKVEAKGLRGCRWGTRPPRVHIDQMKLEWPDADAPGLLCQGCAVAET